MKPCKKKNKLSILCALLLLFSCTSIRQPAPIIHYYTLRYPPLVLTGLPPIQTQVLVRMYSASSLLQTNDMVYQSGGYQLYSDPYHKWQEMPEEMVLSCLLRNFQASGLFLGGVFGTGTVVKPQYVLEGRLDVFCATAGKNGRSAVISVTATLIRKASNHYTVFQKQYNGKELLKQDDPDGLARAMSAALEKISASMLTDVYHRILDDAGQ